MITITPQKLRLASVTTLAIVLTLGTAQAGVLLPNGTPDTSFANLWAWYKADAGVNGTGTPADGTRVTLWRDQSAGGRNLDQVDRGVSGQPLFIAGGVGGRPALSFDSTTYRNIYNVNTSQNTLPASTATTVFTVAMTAAANGGYVLDGAYPGGERGLRADPANWTLLTTAGTLAAGSIATNTYQVHTMVYRPAGTAEHFINGASVGSGALGASPMAGVIVGNSPTTNQGLYGGVAEILIYNADLSAADRGAVESYLRQKYAPLPPTSATLYARYMADSGVRNQAGNDAQNGDRVYVWEDVSGNSRHLNKIDKSAPPQLSTDTLNGLPVVHFDGSQNIWAASSTWGTLNQADAVFLVTRTEDTNGGYLFDSGSSGNRQTLISGGGAGKWLVNANGSSLVSASITTGTFQVHALLFDGVNTSHYINGALVATGDAGPSGLAGLVVGNNVSTGNFGLNGDIAEMLLYQGRLSIDEQTAVSRFLGAKYGIGIVPEPATWMLLTLGGLGLLLGAGGGRDLGFGV